MLINYIPYLGVFLGFTLTFNCLIFLSFWSGSKIQIQHLKKIFYQSGLVALDHEVQL